MLSDSRQAVVYDAVVNVILPNDRHEPDNRSVAVS